MNFPARRQVLAGIVLIVFGALLMRAVDIFASNLQLTSATAINYDEIDPAYMQTDVQSLISVRSADAVESTRAKLIDNIWSGAGFPDKRLPDKVEQNIADSRYNDLTNLARIDKLTVVLDY